LIVPGTAEPRQLATFLDEVGRLDRQLRGSGLGFLIGDCRRCANQNMEGGGPAPARTIVELFLVRQGTHDAGEADASLERWEHLRSSLSMALPLGAGLAERFTLGKTVPANAAERAVICEALALFGKRPDARRGDRSDSDSPSLLLDGVAAQIRVTQELLAE